MNFCIYNVFERWNPDSKWNCVSVEFEHIRWNHLMFSFRQIRTLYKLISKGEQWFFALPGFIVLSYIIISHAKNITICLSMVAFSFSLYLSISISHFHAVYFVRMKFQTWWVSELDIHIGYVECWYMHKYYFYNL